MKRTDSAVRPRRRQLSVVTALALAVSFGTGLIVVPSKAQDTQQDPLAPRSKGSSQAPITVYEMSDFQCPYCRRHAVESFPLIEAEYIETGKVRWIYVNFPIPSLHPNAISAARLRCGRPTRAPSGRSTTCSYSTRILGPRSRNRGSSC